MVVVEQRKRWVDCLMAHLSLVALFQGFALAELLWDCQDDWSQGEMLLVADYLL